MELRSQALGRIKDISSYAKNSIKHAYNILGSMVHKPYGTAILAFFFYLESACFLPAEPILFVYCIERRNRALWYAFVATIASVLGGITSYLIGKYLWCHFGAQIIHHPYITCVMSPSQFHGMAQSYKRWGFFTILLAGLTPLFPYKVITLSSGFCNVSLFVFVFCSLLVRSIRFFGYATAIIYFGPRFKEFSRKAVVLLSIGICCIISFLWFIARSGVAFS